ncbi:MAG TPA: hypothetical protein VFE90_02570 [Myxococcales bacterium]|nr:hypothetical protein [Myxococcales bacterium]
MRRRVFVVAGEYSASPRDLAPARRRRDWFGAPHPELAREEAARLFFRYPNRGDDGRTKPDDWQRAFGIREPVALPDLLASAAHRALTTLHALAGRGEYRRTCESITDMLVTSMPGLDPNERVNIGLVPQALQVQLGLSPRARAQFVVGTSDSGAQAFAEAVRAARNAERPATILVLAGQIIPSGYVSQYQIRTVLGEDDQAQGLDMLAVGDLVMDALRRSVDLSPADLESFLSRVAQRKAQVGANYPAGIYAGKPFRRDTRRTPWFDASDIAVPCCGAAATIVTSDEALVEAVASSRNPRYRTAPLTEVLGVGDGSTNPDLLHRKAPLVFAPAVYGALADCADDARMPVATFTSCAFGVVHDAFPSIELSFLLALGLGWDRSAERMAEGWSNPVGGLLTFGHALGASGLVQVNKAHHVFCVDQRYLLEAQSRQGFREQGALAFTTSVGGPLSHIVCSLLRGGHQENRPPRQRRELAVPVAPVSAAWDAKARLLWLLLPSQLRAVADAWLVEGTTSVSIRSCLRALTAEDVARVQFEGLEELIAPRFLEELRQRLRTVVRVVQQESERLKSMFDVFRLLTDEVREIAAECKAQGRVRPEAAGLDERKLADRLKESLRVSLAVLSRPTDGDGAHRTVRFVGPGELQDADFVSAGSLRRLEVPPEALPFWTVRARRPAAPVEPKGNESERLGEVAARGPQTAAELELLRLWFSLDPPQPLLDGALRAAGVALPHHPAVRAIFYAGEIVEPGPKLSPRAAHELLGFVAHRARAFLEAYDSAATQVGPTLSVVAFERGQGRTGSDAAVFSAARFAQEIARSALDHGVVVRAAVAAGEGAVFEDVNGHPAVSSPAARRAADLLTAARAVSPSRPALALDGVSELVVTLLGQRLEGWERAEDGPTGTTIWLGPVR